MLDRLFNLKGTLIMLCVSGSNAYGLDVESSDKDFRGIMLENENHYIGNTKFYQYVLESPDVVVYGLQNFIKLLTQGSPNIVELMGINDQYMAITSDIYRELKDNIQLFLSKKIYYTYRGYANSELLKIQKKSDDKKAYKRAMHMIRLLKMGIEILTDGEILTKRPDQIFLMDIRNGKYEIKEILEFFELYEEQLNVAHNKSSLPAVPDFKKIEELQMRFIRENLFDKR